MVPVTHTADAASVRTIWFGMRCAFTQAAVEGAGSRDGELNPVAIVLPRAPQPVSTGWPAPPFDRWLRERGIEVVEIDGLTGRGHDAITEVIHQRRIELGVGACLPWKVLSRLRAAIPAGVLNIHPSLLPALRGPEPVFHAYRQGLDTTGVTVHVMDAGWDSGPILAQEPVRVPGTGRADAFEAELARRGGQILAKLARPWCDGSIETARQDDARASWAPARSLGDRVLPASLTVAQARRFVTACGPLTATDADAGEAVEIMGTVQDHYVPQGMVVRVRCLDGDAWFRRNR